ncbi:hypothetical protein COLO4_13204 [Corchorus olitorius]|uniref:Uncharacterized protein n=1 Tax=Corchorus olitorius TaxID=93759 RepID=A0A1R3JY17_9ROSI|nr:hypothetical protein COLO4_13204 [Corchorus olitorius]
MGHGVNAVQLHIANNMLESGSTKVMEGAFAYVLPKLND